MKNLIITICCAIVLVSCNDKVAYQKKQAEKRMSKNEKLVKQFNQDLVLYFKATNEKNWNDLEMYMLPEFKGYESTLALLDSFGVSRTVDFTEVSDISEIVRKDSLDYYKIYYSCDITYQMTKDLANEYEQMKLMLGIAYDGKEMISDDSKHSVTIKGNESVIAISAKDAFKWKYVEYLESEKMFYKKFIPSEVLDKL